MNPTWTTLWRRDVDYEAIPMDGKLKTCRRLSWLELSSPWMNKPSCCSQALATIKGDFIVDPFFSEDTEA